jgi:hypothetical protein
MPLVTSARLAKRNGQQSVERSKPRVGHDGGFARIALVAGRFSIKDFAAYMAMGF